MNKPVTLALCSACVVLVFCCVASASPLSAENVANRVKIKSWIAYEKSTELADGSELVQYVAEVDGTGEAPPAAGTLSEPPAKFRISFVPRFNCAPIISLLMPLETDDAEQHQQLLTALGTVKFSVDGTEISFPSLPESSGNVLAAHYDAERRRRNTFRILLEVGYAAEMDLGEYGVYVFSLAGAKLAMGRSVTQCRSHTL